MIDLDSAYSLAVVEDRLIRFAFLCFHSVLTLFDQFRFACILFGVMSLAFTAVDFLERLVFLIIHRVSFCMLKSVVFHSLISIVFHGLTHFQYRQRSYFLLVDLEG